MNNKYNINIANIEHVSIIMEHVSVLVQGCGVVKTTRRIFHSRDEGLPQYLCNKQMTFDNTALIVCIIL